MEKEDLLERINKVLEQVKKDLKKGIMYARLEDIEGLLTKIKEDIEKI